MDSNGRTGLPPRSHFILNNAVCHLGGVGSAKIPHPSRACEQGLGHDPPCLSFGQAVS